MDFSNVQSIANIVFLIIVVILSIVALLAIYIVIKYGRTFGVSSLTSMIFGGVFILQVIAAFATLQLVF